MSSPPPTAAHTVALQGFSEFERNALASYFRLAVSREPAYAQVQTLEAARFIIADADQPGVIDALLAADRVADTVFIGAQAPDGALAWMMRPIDPLHVFREIDATLALRNKPAPAGPGAAPTGAALATGGPRRAGDSAAPTSALLVDDSEIALRFLERLLQTLGLRTELANNSARTLELLTERKFDVVFLDVDLGDQSELDGLTLCQRIKHYRRPELGPTAKVVMVSAHAAAVDRVRGTLAGCDAYLAKPLDDESLRRTLRAIGVAMPSVIDPPRRRSSRYGDPGPGSGAAPLDTQR